MSGRERPLDLGELIDLELQFAADREAERQTLRERDERIGRRIFAAAEPRSRHEVFRRWLSELRAGNAPTAGQRIESLYHWIGLVLPALAFFAGAGTARAVLAYDGTHPVNIVHFLAVFVAMQLGLVGLSIATTLPAVRAAGRRAYAPIHELIRQLVYRRSGITQVAALAPALGRLGALGTVYGPAERWTLAALTQRVAFFFNAGALAACFYLIAFTDLAFAWSTTLEITSATMTSLLRALAWPWRWLDGAVPDAGLVEASRYYRLAGRYDPLALKDWWAFLIAALVTYGLLPRFVLWQLAAWRARMLRRRLPLDHGDAQVAYERVTRCLHGWCGPEPGTASSAPVTRVLEPSARAVPAGRGIECTVVRWADVPLADAEAARLVAERFGWSLGSVHACGGRQSAAEAADTLAAIAREPRDRPLVVLAEAWEAPSRAVMRFLGELRRAGGARRNFVVGLLGARNGTWAPPERDDFEVWSRGVAALGDPYLRVEPMIETGA